MYKFGITSSNSLTLQRAQTSNLDLYHSEIMDEKFTRGFKKNQNFLS